MGNTHGGHGSARRHNSSGDSSEAIPSLTVGGRQSSSIDDRAFGAEFGEFRMRTTSLGQTPPQQDKVPMVFKWKHGGKEVFLSGSFDNWKTKIPLAKEDENYHYTIVDLNEGTHEYKFLVDGHWKHDTKTLTVSNEVGSVNNVVTVKRSDFEVFEALAVDSFNTGSKRDQKGSPKGSYARLCPSRTRMNERQTTPPVLPPHLLQVILNKDIPVDIEPTLLPQPNHVMLNHLYALSIKDGVMVLSATHRYRKKYVTTLLYKPI